MNLIDTHFHLDFYRDHKTDPDLNAGGRKYFIPHNRILTDHLFGIGLYFSVQLFFEHTACTR